MVQHDEPNAPRTPGQTALAAYEQTLPEMLALPDSDLLIVNLDIPTTIGKVLASLPQLRAVEAQMAARWQHPPRGLVDRVVQYVGALEQTHWLCQGLKVVQPDPSRIARELAPLRLLILDCVRPLVRVGVLDATLLEPYQFVRSHRSLARSVCGLVTMCRAHWAVLQNKVPLATADLDRAFALAVELSVALGAKGRRPEPVSRALQERQQAFTLLIQAYGGLRRAALFLYPRREEAERMAPSLYRKQARSARRPRPAVNVTAN